MSRRLTARQAEILDFLTTFIEERGYPPSLREISARFGINSPKNARKHLNALEAKGFIKRVSGLSRAIEISSTGSGGIVTLPVVGRVRAGMPQPAVEDIEGYVRLDSGFFGCREGFILRVEGESMMGAGIREGSYVVVKPQKDALNGEIVVAMIDGEATVKRFIKDGDTVILKPENPDMEPVRVTGGDGREVSIIGKVVAIIEHVR